MATTRGPSGPSHRAAPPLERRNVRNRGLSAAGAAEITTGLSAAVYEPSPPSPTTRRPLCVCVCMCVCVCVRACVRECIAAPTHTHKHTQTHRYIHINIY